LSEPHKHEQYFFDAPRLDQLAGIIAASWQAPCCLCAPLLGRCLAEQSVNVGILEIDDPFAGVPSFRGFYIRRTEWLGNAFD
jgi:hypothetical protein